MGFPILVACILPSAVKQAWCPCSSVLVAGSLDMYFISPGLKLLHGITAASLHDNTRQSNRRRVNFWALGSLGMLNEHPHPRLLG